MKTFRMILVILLVMLPVASLAHHPAEDIVDEEIYEMIDTMVADTPHAELEFNDMGMIIDTDTVSAAEDLIDEGLLADLSLLDGEVTVTIEFLPIAETGGGDLMFSTETGGNNKNKNIKKWSEWGCPVKITVVQEKD